MKTGVLIFLIVTLSLQCDSSRRLRMPIQVLWLRRKEVLAVYSLEKLTMYHVPQFVTATAKEILMICKQVKRNGRERQFTFLSGRINFNLSLSVQFG